MCNKFFKSFFLMMSLISPLSYAYGMEPEEDFGIIQNPYLPVIPQEALWQDTAEIEVKEYLDLPFQKSLSEDAWLAQAIETKAKNSPSYVQSIVYGQGVSSSKDGSYNNDVVINICCQKKYEQITACIYDELYALWPPQIKPPVDNSTAIDFRIVSPNMEDIVKFVSVFYNKGLVSKGAFQ